MPKVEQEDLKGDSLEDGPAQGRRSTRLNPSARPAVSSESSPQASRPSRSPSNPAPSKSARARLTKIKGSRLSYRKGKLAEFYDWMEERNAVFDRRYEDPKQLRGPWTTSEKMRAVRTCNVFRELDGVSQFLIREIINAVDALTDLDNLIFQVTLFRMFNSPATYTELCAQLGGKPTLAEFVADPNYLKNAMDTMFDNGTKLTSSAYKIWAPHLEDGEEHIDHRVKVRILEHIFITGMKKGGQPIVGTLPERLKDLSNGLWIAGRGTSMVEAAFEEVTGYYLFGPFLGFQLLIDLSYLPGLDFDFERDGWVSTGPGSKSGLELIFNCREKDTDLHLEAMTFIKTEQAAYWADSGKTPPTLLGNGRPIGLVEIEHALCEFSKYCNVTKAQLDSKAKRTNGKKWFVDGSAVTGELPRKYVRV